MVKVKEVKVCFFLSFTPWISLVKYRNSVNFIKQKCSWKWHSLVSILKMTASLKVKETDWRTFNPIGPTIHIQFLQTDLHTFPYKISWENLIKNESILQALMIISLILKTFSLDDVLKLLGENNIRQYWLA